MRSVLRRFTSSSTTISSPTAPPLVYAPSDTEERAIGAWLDQDPRRRRGGTWVNDRKGGPILWEADGRRYSPSGLVSHIWQQAEWREQWSAVQGPKQWRVPEEGGRWWRLRNGCGVGWTRHKNRRKTNSPSQGAHALRPDGVPHMQGLARNRQRRNTPQWAPIPVSVLVSFVLVQARPDEDALEDPPQFRTGTAHAGLPHELWKAC